jgi:hypothetical protein
MELPKTLENLLGCLLAENGLLSWQIFDERSSHIVVKIRFGNGHCGPTTANQSTETVTTYRRKPPSQVKRDHARVAAHKCKQSTAPGIQTRSMAAACLPTEPREEKQKAHNSDHGSCELAPTVASTVYQFLIRPFQPHSTSIEKAGIANAKVFMHVFHHYRCAIGDFTLYRGHLHIFRNQMA